MRKLLVIVLMLALVPFTTGCRVDGLWGFDDDNGTTGTPTTSKTLVPIKLLIPETVTTKASIREDFSISTANVTVLINGVDVPLTAANTTTTVNSVVYREYTHAGLEVSNNYVAVSGSNYVFTVKIAKNGTTYSFTINVPTSLAYTPSTSGTVTTNTTNVVSLTLTKLEITSDGKVTWAVTVVYTPVGQTTTTSTTQTEQTSGTAQLYVSSAIYAGTTTTAASSDLSESSVNPTTGIDWTAPIFKVKFNSAVSNPTSFEVIATNTVNNSAVTLTKASSQLNVEMDPSDSTNKTIKASVTGQGTRSLKPGTLYSVQVKATVSATTGGTSITVSPIYYIKTQATKLTSWVAKDANGTTVGSWNSTMTTTPTVKTTAKTFVATFDYALKTVDFSNATFLRTDGTSAAFSAWFNTFNATTDLSADKKSVTVSLQTGKALVADTATGYHTIKFGANGSFLDANSTAIDTTTVLKFQAIN